MARSTSLGPNYRKVFSASVISNLGDGIDQIGYPWLASAVTRNPVLIAVVGVAQRLPWLVFSLPAGVITDRVDRRKLMVTMDVCRALLTGLVATAVLGLGRDLPDVGHLEAVSGTRSGLYLILVVSSMLLGCAEVLRDNSAQTIVPSIVAAEHLERANGRMWSVEQVANTFVGPPLGSLLIAGAFFLPFAVDAASFAVAAGIVALVAGQFRASPANGADHGSEERPDWRTDLREGVRWLWYHPLLRPMAIILGVMNGLGAMQLATLVLFAQEVLHTTPIEFAVLTMGMAVGAVIGGNVAPRVRRRLGSGPTLWLVLVSTAVEPFVIGLSSSWPLVLVVFGLGSLAAVMWNVITVSLRQTIIPDRLLGRVNSVYRFFAWGMMPIGTALGGIVVALVAPHWGRTTALRAPWFVASAGGALLLFYAIPRLTTESMEAARADGVAARAEAGRADRADTAG